MLKISELLGITHFYSCDGLSQVPTVGGIMIKRYNGKIISFRTIFPICKIENNKGEMFKTPWSKEPLPKSFRSYFDFGVYCDRNSKEFFSSKSHNRFANNG